MSRITISCVTRRKLEGVWKAHEFHSSSSILTQQIYYEFRQFLLFFSCLSCTILFTHWEFPHHRNSRKLLCILSHKFLVRAFTFTRFFESLGEVGGFPHFFIPFFRQLFHLYSLLLCLMWTKLSFIFPRFYIAVNMRKKLILAWSTSQDHLKGTRFASTGNHSIPQNINWYVHRGYGSVEQQKWCTEGENHAQYYSFRHRVSYWQICVNK